MHRYLHEPRPLVQQLPRLKRSPYFASTTYLMAASIAGLAGSFALFAEMQTGVLPQEMKTRMQNFAEAKCDILARPETVTYVESDWLHLRKMNKIGFLSIEPDKLAPQSSAAAKKAAPAVTQQTEQDGEVVYQLAYKSSHCSRPVSVKLRVLTPQG